MQGLILTVPICLETKICKLAANSTIQTLLHSMLLKVYQCGGWMGVGPMLVVTQLSS